MARRLLLLAILCGSEAFSPVHVPRLSAAHNPPRKLLGCFGVRGSSTFGTSVLEGRRGLLSLRAQRFIHAFIQKRQHIGMGPISAQWLCTDQTLLNDFLETYSGEFHNEKQRQADPSVQYSRKLHTQIRLPSLGENTFFVSEVTDTGGGMQYRLRVSSLSEGSEEGSFQAKHFAFKSEELESKLQSEDTWHLLDSLDPEQDLELVQGGTVIFRKFPGSSLLFGLRLFLER